MKLIDINRHTCLKDGICAEVCPVRLIDFQEGGYPAQVPNAGELCIRCGHCVAACPAGSLLHRDIPVAQCPPVKAELLLSAEQCELFLRNRRSIRAYQEKPVPREALTKLIEVARYAPSGANAQCAQWLVLDNREELRKLSGIVYEWMRWMRANMSEVASLLKMDRSIAGWEAGNDVFLRNAPVLIVAHAEKENFLAPSTCTIALTYLELAATGMDLGGCWAGYLHGAATTFPPMMEALALPAGHQCFGAMMVGYPKFRYHRLPLRNAPVITWRS